MSDTEHPHLAPFILLKTAQGTCPECGIKHETRDPHNQQSLAYQYSFYGKHGRWPTWADAIAHCPPEIQAIWKAELIALGAWKDPDSARDAERSEL